MPSSPPQTQNILAVALVAVALIVAVTAGYVLTHRPAATAAPQPADIVAAPVAIVLPACDSDDASDQVKGALANNPDKNLNIQLLALNSAFEVYDNPKKNIRACIGEAVLNSGRQAMLYTFSLNTSSHGDSVITEVRQLDAEFSDLPALDSEGGQADPSLSGLWTSKNGQAALTFEGQYATLSTIDGSVDQICRILRTKPFVVLSYCFEHDKPSDNFTSTTKISRTADGLSMTANGDEAVLFARQGDGQPRVLALSAGQVDAVNAAVDRFNGMASDAGVVGIIAAIHDCYAGLSDTKLSAALAGCVAFDDVASITFSAVETANKWPQTPEFQVPAHSARVTKALSGIGNADQEAAIEHQIDDLVMEKATATANAAKIQAPPAASDNAPATSTGSGQESGESSCGEPFPCQLEAIIDQSDWDGVRSALFFATKIGSHDRMNWKGSHNGHHGYVVMGGADPGDPACNNFSVVSYMGTDRGTREVSVCKRAGGVVEVK